jgi:tetratricopeptide (TPR) repeat protein
MLRILLILGLWVTALGQDIPRARPVDPALETNPAIDFYQHGRNVYESAKRTEGQPRQELLARAVEIFSVYIDRFPRHPNARGARWYLGESFYLLGRLDDARRCYHQLLNQSERDRYASAAAYKLGADHFNHRKYALAANLFDRLATLATSPAERQRGLYYAGLSYEQMDRQKNALVYYRAVVADPADDNPYLQRSRLAAGKILARDGKLQQALDLLEPVVASQAAIDLRGEAALQAGVTAARLGDAALAQRYFDQVLDTPGMEAFRPDAQIAMMAAAFEKEAYREVVRIFERSDHRSEGESEARRLMLAARAHMMLESHADALRLFREIEKIQPPESLYAFHASYYRLLCFYRIEGRYMLDQVDAFLELYRRRHPRDAKVHTALLMKAETLYADGDVDAAAETYRRIDATLLSEKNRPGLFYQRGRCLADAGDSEAAAASLEAFINAAPADPRVPLARAARAKAFEETGASGKALAEYQATIESSEDPTLLTLAFLNSAEILRNRNELDAMVAQYRTFLDQVPSAGRPAIAKASYWAGWGLVKSDRPEEAEPFLQKARQLAPETYESHAGLLLCLVHLARKQPEPLIEEVAKAIAEGYAADLPEPLLRWAADQAFNAGDYVHAASFYGQIADEDNPELVAKEVWRFLGKARIRAGQPEAALTAITHALDAEKDPVWRADGLTDRGQALFDLGKLDAATAAVEEGLTLRPEGRIGAGLHLLRGDILMAQNDPQKAIQSYILPVQLMDDNDQVVKPEALSKLVKALEQVGKIDDADKYRRELNTKYPSWPRN